jgi:hypothetical protein
MISSMQIPDRLQLATILVMSLSLITDPARFLVRSLSTQTSSARPTKTPRHHQVQPKRIRNKPLGIFILFCFCLTVTAQADNPTCSKNICELPPNKCVETCPRNEKGRYFKFGLRSNKKCTASKPGKALDVNGSIIETALPSIGAPQFEGDRSTDSKELAGPKKTHNQNAFGGCVSFRDLCVSCGAQRGRFIMVPMAAGRREPFKELLRGQPFLRILRC